MTNANMTMLVTAVAGDIGASVVKALGNSGVTLVGCDTNVLCPVKSSLASFHKSPPASEVDAYVEFLLGVVRKAEAKFLLPISEPEICVLDSRRTMFEDVGVMLVMNSNKVLSHLMDKLETARYLSSIGVAVPRTAPMRGYDDSFGFPVVVKARMGCGSKRLWVVEDVADLEYLRRKDQGDLVVQESVGRSDSEYTTGVFSDGTTVSSISFLRKLGYGGLSKEAVYVDEPKLARLSEKVAQSLDLVGAINIQTRMVNGEFIPFEINPRLSSTVLFRKAFGFDDAVWWVEALQGKRHSYKPRYRSGIAVRGVSEHYFDMKEV